MYKVLVVEDENIIRKGLIFSVDWKRIRCVIAGEARNGREGAAMIQKLKPDIVITDVKMPIMGGPEMIRETVNEYRYESIIISGYSEFEYARQAIRLGVTEYLLKPVEIDKLEEALLTVIRKLNQRNSRDGSGDNDSGILSWPPTTGGPVSKKTKKILEYIEEHYREKISLQDACMYSGLSPTGLNENLKISTGSTFTVLLNRYRIIRAVILLGSGNFKVYEAAREAGFEDYKYFSSVFRKYTGSNPSEFLEKNNKSII